MPKKSLGQNFLRDDAILNRIIKSANLNASDNVIEIGPGEGVLTKELVKHANKLILIEKDDQLANKLAHNFQFSIFNFQLISNDLILKFKNKSAIIAGDILEINLPRLIEKNNFQKYKVVANIPYYITSPIIRLFLETAYPPEEMILMVQREVAERICASPGQHSILSISVQYYAKPELLFNVKKESFWPVPEVDSAVIKIRVAQNREHLTKEKDAAFFRVVKAGFSAKRKTLLNNLSTSLQLNKNIVKEKIISIGHLSTVRAQELSVTDWQKLVELL